MDKFDKLIKKIVSYNNRYRDRSSSPIERLRALWYIGDVLVKGGVDKPHTCGWAIQKETKGLIKRPIIFRGFKARAIWESVSEMNRSLSGLKGMSNFIEMLPFIDPQQSVRGKLTDDELIGIYHRACIDSPGEFCKYLNSLKGKYVSGRLGQKLDKSKHLNGLHAIEVKFTKFASELTDMMHSDDVLSREEFRSSIPAPERIAFSNMCLSLTTKQNFRLYRSASRATFTCNHRVFSELYRYFRVILEKKSDIERARIRKLLASELLASVSDMLSSMDNESAVRDYLMRERVTLDL